ncbi:hypothetical protein [Entomospira culicis]|uniref:hypothetical protein n=1 Tax=Entomospira culicis TaxID=2719989 RepID=UPI002368E81A|nr:hypothetical protein [Entomospira culicis]
MFSYNRPTHVRLAIEALAKSPLAKESALYICSDAPRTKKDEPEVSACRAYFEQIEGFKSVQVVALTENHNVKKAAKVMGEWMSKKYEAWISIEDDILVHEDFLRFMNDALVYYRDNEKVACVMGFAYDSVFEKALIGRGYAHDVLFTQAFYAFGWATWAHKWQSLEITMPSHDYFKGMGSYLQLLRRSWAHLASHRVASKPTSELWDVHFCYEMIRKGLVAVMPVRSYLQNIGFDGSGLHKYHFGETFFQERLQPREDIAFTNHIHISDNYHSSITFGVIRLWIRAFWGNLWLILGRKSSRWWSKPEKVLVFSEKGDRSNA